MTEASPPAPADAGQAQGQGASPPASPASPPSPPAASGGDKPWYDGHITTPEDIGYVQNKGWKNPLEAVTAYKNLEKFHGVPADQLLKLPKDMSDEKAMGDIYARLGRPETPEGYEFKAPEGVQLDEGRMKWANGISHKLGLNKAQHAALVNETLKFEGGILKEHQEDIAAKQETELNALKKEWGGKYDERAELGRRAVRSFVPGDKKDEMLNQIESAIGTAAMLKMFGNIGERLGEDKVHDGDRSGSFGYTPEQAKADMATLQAELKDPNNKERLSAYNQGKGKDYEKMTRLQTLAYGSQKTA